MKDLPVGKQNFKEIIENDFLYVDKTRQIHELVRKGGLYFLSRPRRFGKSLLLSKFKHLFSGEKDLFKGLYIYEQTDYAFEAYPVLQFNFAQLGRTSEKIEDGLQFFLEEYALQYQLQLPLDKTLEIQLYHLVTNIAQKQGKPVVLLIDEYDKPIINALTDIKKASANRAVIKDFFSPLKDLDAQGHLHFLFITGVTKFSKVSIFSDLNNLTDLTLHRFADDLLGITQEELLTYFSEHIQATTPHFKYTPKRLLKEIKFWYNGYAFNPAIKLYNPFSLLNFFSHRNFGNFWFASGTPTFLVNAIRNQGVRPEDLEHIVVSEHFFDKHTIERIDIPSFLFQAGYLTIKSTKTRHNRTKYYLGYPNEEVRLSMMHNLMEAFTDKQTSLVSEALLLMEESLEEGQVAGFVEQLEILLSDISYHLLPKKKRSKVKEFDVWEGYFHTIIYLVTAFMGYHVQSEITKHKGRLDLLVTTADYLYLMEFKLDDSAQNAIDQIKNRQYAAAYKNSPKTIYLVDIGFSKKERNVEDWDVEIWER